MDPTHTQVAKGKLDPVLNQALRRVGIPSVDKQYRCTNVCTRH